ncbi:uncharacterized protein L201_004037 [Kwoniella dendrophila CBS 6074]|uniref:Uncharacterized protein n=1 Tax=Kwoniella dendrophila CBS 6074 TaxID=1295534 RepID=A0AAX4JW68_9TREE
MQEEEYKLDDPPTLSNLLFLAQSKQVLFRLHTPTSNSPLLWTGSLKTSGFSSPNSHLSYLTPKSYISFYSYNPSFSNSSLRDKIIEDNHQREKEEELVEDEKRKQKEEDEKNKTRLISNNYELIKIGDYLRHTIVDHILNKTKQTCLKELSSIEEIKEGIWEDEKTLWISTSENLFWIIWEIARKLSIDEKNEQFGWVTCVQIAIIKHPNSFIVSTSNQKQRSKGNPKDGEALLVLEPDNFSDAAIDGAREMWLRPVNFLSPNTYPGEFSVSLKEQYEVSRKAATSSNEVLFFGRIFAENIISNLEWTRESTPFELPSYLFQDPSNNPTAKRDSESDSGRRRRKQERWIDYLIWDPQSDEYLTAHQRVMNRRRDESRLNGTSWPNGPL